MTETSYRLASVSSRRRFSVARRDLFGDLGAVFLRGDFQVIRLLQVQPGLGVSTKVTRDAARYPARRRAARARYR